MAKKFETPKEFWEWFEQYCDDCATCKASPFGFIHPAPVDAKLIEMGVYSREASSIFEGRQGWQKENQEKIRRIMNKVGKKYNMYVRYSGYAKYERNK